MKWKKKPHPKIGDTRTVRRLHILPRTYGYDVFCLERVWVRQMYRRCGYMKGTIYPMPTHGWVDIGYSENGIDFNALKVHDYPDFNHMAASAPNREKRKHIAEKAVSIPIEILDDIFND